MEPDGQLVVTYNDGYHEHYKFQDMQSWAFRAQAASGEAVPLLKIYLPDERETMLIPLHGVRHVKLVKNSEEFRLWYGNKDTTELQQLEKLLHPSTEGQ